jgi:hypothetical protein
MDGLSLSPHCVFFIVVSAFRKECITKIMLSVTRMPAAEISSFVLQLQQQALSLPETVAKVR